MNEEFNNDKVWEVILKSSSFSTFITVIDQELLDLRNKGIRNNLPKVRI